MESREQRQSSSDTWKIRDPHLFVLPLFVHYMQKRYSLYIAYTNMRLIIKFKTEFSIPVSRNMPTLQSYPHHHQSV